MPLAPRKLHTHPRISPALSLSPSPFPRNQNPRGKGKKNSPQHPSQPPPPLLNRSLRRRRGRKVGPAKRTIKPGFHRNEGGIAAADEAPERVGEDVELGAGGAGREGVDEGVGEEGAEVRGDGMEGDVGGGEEGGLERVSGGPRGEGGGGGRTQKAAAERLGRMSGAVSACRVKGKNVPSGDCRSAWVSRVGCVRSSLESRSMLLEDTSGSRVESPGGMLVEGRGGLGTGWRGTRGRRMRTAYRLKAGRGEVCIRLTLLPPRPSPWTGRSRDSWQTRRRC